MELTSFLAWRYLFSRKKHHAINIVSGIAVCGISLATMAMICTLSVFNGFHDVVASLFTCFDPELKIIATEGKVFNPRESRLSRVHDMPEISVWSETIEEQAMIQYKDCQLICTIKGVEDNFEQLTAIDSILYGNNQFITHSDDNRIDLCIPGVNIVNELNSGIAFLDPLKVYAPRRNAHINIANPSMAFSHGELYASGSVFVVNQEKYDNNYIITSLPFARRLFHYSQEVSAIEIKLKEGVNQASVQQKMQQTLGTHFRILNRYEQQADAFHIMKIEKLISYFFLSFILVIACFNIIGSLSMLIIDKKDDIQTLRNLGADKRFVTNVFLLEGRLISIIGAITGLVLGVFICWVQQHFGLLKLGNGENFLINAYPVNVRISDILIVLVTVVTIGFISVWYPVKYLCKRILTSF